MLHVECDRLFEAMVESVGVKAFAHRMGLSTRQVHRMLSGSQPNPLRRLCEAIKASDGPAARDALDFVAGRCGGYFIDSPPDFKSANLNAVKEAAEAIVAISEGAPCRVTIREVREAISALAALERILAAPPAPAAGDGLAAPGPAPQA
jgi:hypothetical protein